MSQQTLSVAPNGRVVIPASFRSALGIPEGGKVVARLVDGTLVIEPIGQAIRRAQEIVRRYVPDGRGLVDELIAERHDASSRE